MVPTLLYFQKHPLYRLHRKLQYFQWDQQAQLVQFLPEVLWRPLVQILLKNPLLRLHLGLQVFLSHQLVLSHLSHLDHQSLLECLQHHLFQVGQ